MNNNKQLNALTFNRVSEPQKLLQKLFLGHKYMLDNPDKKTHLETLCRRSEGIIAQLESLGVPSIFSKTVFYLGVEINDNAVEDWLDY